MFRKFDLDMCLTLTEKSKLKTVEEDIICYKVVRKLCPGIYRSEFYAYLYETGTLNTSPFGDTITITTRPRITTYYRGINFNFQDITGYEQVVERGFHSFTCKEDAYKYAERYRYSAVSYVVVKCTIPKGANYIEGMYSEYPNYVSNKIICLGEV